LVFLQIYVKLVRYQETRIRGLLPQVREDKFEIRNKYITFVKAATEGNEKTLMMLDLATAGGPLVKRHMSSAIWRKKWPVSSKNYFARYCNNHH
jgi:hypothetical protein